MIEIEASQAGVNTSCLLWPWMGPCGGCNLRCTGYNWLYPNQPTIGGEALAGAWRWTWGGWRGSWGEGEGWFAALEKPELGTVLVTEKNGPHVPLRGHGLAVVSVAGVPLEARRVCGQFQGPEAQGPPPPGALTAPWWQVKPPLAPGGLRGTALGPPFHSARVQRGTTKTRRCPSPATATPRSTARRQPRLATQVGGFGALFCPHADPASATKVKTN